MLNVKNLRISDRLKIIAVGEGHDPPAENRHDVRISRREITIFSPDGEQILLCKSAGGS